MQFVNVGDCSSRLIAISNLVNVTNARAGNSAANGVDQLYVWNGADWTIYYNQTGVGFVKNDAADKTVPTSDTVNAGDGVFFRRANYNKNADLTTAGGLYAGDTVSYSLSARSFTFISYPWPKEFPIADFIGIMTNPRAGNSAANGVDQVYVWNGSDWNIYYNQTGVGFVAIDAADKTVPTTDTISVGTCVFFRRANFNQNAVITFTKPSGI